MPKNDSLGTIWEIPDDLWNIIAPYFPEPKPPGSPGRPRSDMRAIFQGIIWQLRTGCQWKALDETDICPASTAHDRFQEWVKAGVFLKLWQAGVAHFDELQGIEWEWLSMDGAMTKAPLGGGEKRPQSH